jgi:hypothetical protein
LIILDENILDDQRLLLEASQEKGTDALRGFCKKRVYPLLPRNPLRFVTPDPLVRRDDHSDHEAFASLFEPPLTSRNHLMKVQQGRTRELERFDNETFEFMLTVPLNNGRWSVVAIHQHIVQHHESMSRRVAEFLL